MVKEVDAWIEHLLKCKPLDEKYLKILLEKVRFDGVYMYQTMMT